MTQKTIEDTQALYQKGEVKYKNTKFLTSNQIFMKYIKISTGTICLWKTANITFHDHESDDSVSLDITVW